MYGTIANYLKAGFWVLNKKCKFAKEAVLFMDFVFDDLKVLKKKITELTEKYRQIKSENKQLIRERDLLKEELERLKQQQAENEAVRELDLFAQTLVGNNRLHEKAAKRVDGWIKTIDKVIRYIEKNGA